MISNNKIYRAIELNIRLFRWEKALKLALSHQVHIDTVLAFRNRYLETNNFAETIELFQQQSDRIENIDLQAIDQQRKHEIEQVCLVCIFHLIYSLTSKLCKCLLM